MSANVETMFSVREKPWHGLGTILDTNPRTVEEALNYAGLNWKVNPYPLFTSVNDVTVPVPEFFANVRDKDNTTLGVVGKNYKIVQNVEAFDFCDALMDGEAKFETAGSLNNGKRVWVLVKLPNFQVLGEDYENYMYITNSFDGAGAIKMGITPIRIQCQNTLNIALKTTSRSWRVTHHSTVTNKMEEASKALELNNSYTRALAEEAEKLASIKVSTPDFHKLAVELFPMNDKMSERQKDNVDNMRLGFSNIYFNTPDIQNFKGTAWGVLQGLTDFTQHSTPLRETATYKAKLFEKVIDGQAIIDEAYEKLLAYA